METPKYNSNFIFLEVETGLVSFFRMPSESEPQRKKAKRTDSEKEERKKLKAETNQKFLDTNEIRITSLDNKPYHIDPIFKFKSGKFPEALLKALSAFEKPTPIQSVAWPPILAGNDLVGISATGSGKTLSFGLPAMISLNASPKNLKPHILVLSPTRELAMQTQEQFERFGKVCGMKSVCIYGGVSKRDQKDALRRGMNTIVATPGRLIDLFEEDSKICDLSQVKYLVLDEADRMLDQGFEEAIKTIIGRLPTCAEGRQTVMFSATWPTSIQKMAMTYLKSPIKITVGSTDLSANTSIEQRVEVLDPFAKEARLIELLKDYHKSKKNRILIFALYKKEAARLEAMIKRQGYKAAALHGDLSQEQRSAAIEGFKNGSIPLLIATDVAARGIDIPMVEYVINVTFPLTVEDYCHRIGRTGRAGTTGISHTLFTVHDKAHSGTKSD